MANLRLNLSEIDKIKSIHKINKSLRKKNLDNFNNFGLPSKKDEDWKFSDFKKILDQNFSKYFLLKSISFSEIPVDLIILSKSICSRSVI